MEKPFNAQTDAISVNDRNVSRACKGVICL